MKTTRTGPTAFTVEFQDEEELRREYALNLSQGGLKLETGERVPLHSVLLVTLRGPFGAGKEIQATAVAPLPGGVALAIGTMEKDLLEHLLTRIVPVPVPMVLEPAEAAVEEALEVADDADEPAEAEEVDERGPSRASQSQWDRVRGMGRMERIAYAARAERGDRALLLQDIDPQVLYNLLKNPRVTVDEVVRVAKASSLTFQTAEAIMKSTLWLANLDVRVALVHNPKTPPAFALRILPTLPESEVKVIARGAATSMALKTAALRRLQTGS